MASARGGRYAQSGPVNPARGSPGAPSLRRLALHRSASGTAAGRGGSSSTPRSAASGAGGGASSGRTPRSARLTRTGSKPETSFRIASLHRSDSSRSLARERATAPMRFLQASARGQDTSATGSMAPTAPRYARPRRAWGTDDDGSVLDQRPLDVPAIKPHPVSKRLQKYKTHDLLLSHLKRVANRNDTAASKATKAAMWQLSYRTELEQQARASADGGSPKPVDRGGFLYHTMETQAEFDMHELWVAKRKNEIARKKNEAQVKAALDEWQQHRNRIEAEIQRKIEAKRAPPPHPIPVIPNTRQAYTPIPSGRPQSARPETDEGPPTRPSSAASSRVTFERPVSRGSIGSRASRPASAGTRRRLATPVAIPRKAVAHKKPVDNRPAFGRYANKPPVRAAALKPGGPPSSRFGPPEGPPRARPPVPASSAVMSAAALAKMDRELSEFETAAAGRQAQRGLGTSTSQGTGGSGAVGPPSRPLSAMAREQMDEVEAIRRCFAKYGMKAPEKALKRALVVTDDKPANDVRSLPAPGANLPENPLLEMKLALFGPKKKKKKGKGGGKKKKGKKKGAGGKKKKGKKKKKKKA